ncbi:alpha/beta fold hydrolase [Pseudonocardia parietis]|uniref:Pimeloyl-ACP methyl ester carboxylesterase n=1 Tax=Pseudonocardia parietis TaxID=570936 RepID=A0ABS4VWH3_9PSEU|nr:alpha/beta hydrolase [Pseudonocardia parietis]MBP2368265.1 pimeloyl-ACP methyl ester carboxylesterase [Pseudonocardia parietis]
MPHSQGEHATARTRDGRLLYLQHTPGPAGVPTVVLEAGMGTTRSSWAAVQRAIAGAAPVVVYDRSGLGRSAPDPGPPTLDRLAADLNDLLDHVGAEDYVLAGHSWGGPIVRVAAAQRPERIRGLVLVDPTDEGCELYFSPAFAARERASAAVLPLLARLGLTRLAAGPVARRLPADAAADLRAEWLTPAGIDAHLAESASLPDDLCRLRAEPPPGGTAPVTVISGTATAGIGRRSRAALNTAHAARAGAGPERRHVLALRSGHLVPLTEPELVAGEILRLTRDRRP